MTCEDVTVNFSEIDREGRRGWGSFGAPSLLPVL